MMGNKETAASHKLGIIVITGAADGIGRATTHLFAAAGYPILLIDRNEKKLLQLVDELAEKYHDTHVGKSDEEEEELWKSAKCMALSVDVASYKEIKKAVDDGVNYFNRDLALLVNDAGVLFLGDIKDQPVEEFNSMFQINSMGVVNGMKAVLPIMENQQHGTIINISSICGFKPFKHHAGYCSSKYAVRGMTEAARMECARSNIRVISICPGVVDTHILSSTTNPEMVKDYHEKLVDEGCDGCKLEPHDIADAIMYAFNLPQGVCVRELVIAPTKQIP